jgi:hypothetical protein
VDILFGFFVPSLLYTSHQEKSADPDCDEANPRESSGHSSFVVPETEQNMFVIAQYKTEDIAHPEPIAPAGAAVKDGGGTS